MKAILARTGLILSVCVLAAAQDTTGDRVVVPARNTSHPRVVNVSLSNGAITVKAYNGKDVTVEDTARAGARPAPNGMRRIGVANRGLEVVEEDNVITIRNRMGGTGHLTIMVPVDTSLKLRTMSGPITAEGVHGEVEVHTQNGHIALTDISGTVSADSQNGPIKVTMDRVDQSKPLAFSTFNGDLDLTFPPDFKSNLTVRSNHGPVFTDFEVTLGGSRVVTEPGKSSEGRFRIRIDNTIRGTINGGGVDTTIRTFNGPVYLRKKK